jgi:hypothetical protein
MLRHVAPVRTDYIVFLCSVHWFLVTSNIVPSALILVTLMMEAIRYSETSVLARATWCTSKKMAYFIVTALETSNLSWKIFPLSFQFFFLMLIWVYTITLTVVPSSNVQMQASVSEQTASSSNSSDVYLWGTCLNLNRNTSCPTEGFCGSAQSIQITADILLEYGHDSFLLRLFQFIIPLFDTMQSELFTMSLNDLQVRSNEPSSNQNAFTLVALMCICIQTGR